jgi:PAS domain S-box-containing protein
MAYRFLILEDNPNDVDLMVRHLKKADLDFTYKAVDNQEDFEEELVSFEPHLILSDFKLPGFNGLEAIKINNAFGGEIPLIIVSATVGDEVAVELMKEGATDYILKDNLKKVPVVVNRTLQEFEEHKRRKTLEEKAQEHLARLNYLFNSSLDGIVITQPDGKIRDANPAACQMFGYSIDEIKDLNREDLIVDRNPDTDLYSDEDQSKDAFRGVVKMRRKDESTFLVDLTTRQESEYQNLEGSYLIFRDISKRIEAMRDLKAQEEMYRLLAENSSDVVVQSKDKGKLTYVSPSVKDLLGYEPQELIGIQGEEMVHPDDMDTYLHGRERLYGEKDQWRAILRLRAKSGDYVWTELIGKTIFDSESGEISEVQTTIRDVSERVEAHRQLEREKEFVESLVNSLPGLFFLISEDLVLTKSNKNLAQVLGYEQDEILDHDPRDFVVPSQRDKALAKIEQAFQQGYTEVELDLLHKDGSHIPFLLTGVTTQQNSDMILIGTGIDITDRKEAEEELLQEKTFVDRAINSLPGLFYVIDEEQNYIRVNDNFIEELGYSWEEIQQMHPLEFYQEKDHEYITKAIQKAFTEGEATATAQVVTKNGEKPWYQLTGAYVQQDGKNYILGTGINITERVEAEMKLKDALQENRVLLSEVHHRVKNNLAVIAGILQLQSMEVDDETVKAKLLDSDMRIKSIARIHEQLYQSKTFSDIRFDKHIEELAREINKTYTTEIPVEITTELTAIRLSMEKAIPAALISYELISNSFKHSLAQHENPELNITLFEEAGNISIRICDNGDGLPEDFSLEESKSLGLELVSILTQQIGGEITYSNKNGACFHLTFET